MKHHMAAKIKNLNLHLATWISSEIILSGKKASYRVIGVIRCLSYKNFLKYKDNILWCQGHFHTHEIFYSIKN